MAELPWFSLFLVFLIVTGATLAAAWTLNRNLARRQLAQRVLPSGVGRDATTRPNASGGAAPEGWSGAEGLVKRLESWLAPLANWARPGGDTEEYSRLQLRLAQAGWAEPYSARIFFGTKAALALLLAAAAALALVITRAASPLALQMSWVLGAALAGYLAPNLVLALRVTRRQRELFEAFPDAIDLMIVCLEAGMGLDAAVQRASREVGLRSTAMAAELGRVALQLQAGDSRERAFRQFALRLGLEEASSLVATLLQADRFGTPMADALRVHAEVLRQQRRLLAEETAAKIPLKLLFPLIFFIFPTLLLVLIGPALLQVYRVMLPAL